MLKRKQKSKSKRAREEGEKSKMQKKKKIIRKKCEKKRPDGGLTVWASEVYFYLKS